MPVPYSALSAYRALERGGKQSLNDFRHVLGLPARVAFDASNMARPLLDNPGRVMSIIALTAAVLAGGLYAGFELRKRRLGCKSAILTVLMKRTAFAIPRPARIMGL